MAEFLLQNGVDINGRDESDWDESVSDNLEGIYAEINAGQTSKSMLHFTALHYAALHLDLEGIQYIRNKGGDTDLMVCLQI